MPFANHDSLAALGFASAKLAVGIQDIFIQPLFPFATEDRPTLQSLYRKLAALAQAVENLDPQKEDADEVNDADLEVNSSAKDIEDVKSGRSQKSAASIFQSIESSIAALGHLAYL